MREFETSIGGLNKGLRAFSNRPRNEEGLTECYNVAPGDEGPEIHEVITSLNADGVSWGGEGKKSAATLTRDITIYVADYVADTDLATVAVWIDGVSKGNTDANGELAVSGITIGGHTLKLTKTGYTDSDQDDLYNDYILVI